MGQLQEIESELKGLGYQIVAASADRPEKLTTSLKQSQLSYRLVSDASQKGAIAFGLAFRVDEETVGRYQRFGADLEEASGQDHHILPVPAVYLVDKDRTIQFMYANPNYRVRLDPGLLLAAARLHAK